MNERYKLDLSFLQSCFGKYNGTTVETMRNCSSYIPFRTYRSQPPRRLTRARTWTVPVLRSRVRTALILFLFSSVTL